MGKKLTNEEFLEELHKINSNMEPIETYVNYSTPILCKCKICGYEGKISPNNLFYGHGCKMCGIKARAQKRTIKYDQFIQRASERPDYDEYYFDRDSFINIETYMEITHDCGHTFQMTPAVFLSGCRCPKCARKNMPHKYWTEQRVRDYIENTVLPEGYEMVSFNYDKDEIILKHVLCGNVFTTYWHALYYGGHRCPNQVCVNKKIKKTLLEHHGVENAMWSPEIINKRNQYFINTYGSVSPSSAQSVKDKVKQTNIQLYGTANSSQRHYPEYLKKATYDDEYLLSLIKEVNSYSDLVKKYPTDYKIVNALLERLGKAFDGRGWIMEVAEGCQSYAEYRIKTLLEENNVNFRMHYWFNECRSPLTNCVMFFDFAILDNADNVLAIIEYDGEHHYEVIRSWNDTEEKLKERQEMDLYKTNFCEMINIPLYRIPYWEYDNIETKLKELKII